MALPAAGNPISFSQINVELGDDATDTIDLKTASEDLGESTAPFGMNELAGVSGTTAPSFSAFAASGWKWTNSHYLDNSNSPDSYL